MSLIEHAKKEFLLAGYPPLDTPDLEEDPNKWIQENVLELLESFSNQGHSGFSAPFCIGMFKTLAGYGILTPLTGEDGEWIDRSSESGEPMWQNNRCGHVFKKADGVAYDSNGIVFKRPDGTCYTSGESLVNITFPYTPKIVYVDVGET